MMMIMIIVVIRQDGDYNYNLGKIVIAIIFEIITCKSIFEIQIVNYF